MVEANGKNEGFDHERNIGPNGESDVKLNVKKLIDEQEKARI